MVIKKEEKKINREADETLIEKEAIKFQEELKEIEDKKEAMLSEEVISEKELREKIEKMDVDDSLKMQAQKDAQQIKSLKEEEEKIKSLLNVTRDKGVIYAINVAKKMDDPYVLDKLHDMLIEKGYYKKFLK